MRRSPIRIAVLAILLIIAGAVMNIAIAWICAIQENRYQWEGATFPKGPVSEEAHVLWEREFGPSEFDVPEGLPRTQGGGYILPYGSDLSFVRLLEARATGIGWEKITLANGWDVWVHHAWVSRTGLPMYAFEHRHSLRIDDLGSPTIARRIGSLQVSDRIVGSRGYVDVHFPYHPIWPGVIINTLFYVLILWLTFAAPFTIRRARRRRRNQCLACGYPVGTSPVCTECGRSVAPALQQQS